MKSSILFKTLLITLLLSTYSGFGQSGSIYISNLTGDYGFGSNGIGDTIATGVEVTWIIHFYNGAASELSAFNNGFRLYSPDGATWVPLDSGTNGCDQFENVLENYFGGAGEWFLYVAPTNVGSGSSGDTIGFGAFDYRIPWDRMPPGFNGPAIKISIAAPGVSGIDGSSLCLEKSGYTVNDVWLWAFENGESTFPVWGDLPYGYSAPQCYTVYNCCVGTRGDANGDASALPDFQDLNFLVNYIFRAGQLPICPTEGDSNSDGLPVPNIVDLNFLVNYIFRGGTVPGSC